MPRERRWERYGKERKSHKVDRREKGETTVRWQHRNIRIRAGQTGKRTVGRGG